MKRIERFFEWLGEPVTEERWSKYFTHVIMYSIIVAAVVRNAVDALK